ncbi:unnamed protein product [Brugia pahangi]|uniref:Uncharacterized protein n=1 Tax=Brugia pahangi TaxID=6280 RepID=A0A0N4TF47_BRUPA|nr:unnamed protein product [Brugia pahangi]
MSSSAIRSNQKEETLLLDSNDIRTSRNEQLRKVHLSFRKYASSWTADRIDLITFHEVGDTSE